MNIPITLINHVLTNKIVNQFRLYIYLKSVCSGHFKVDGDFISKTCTFLEIKTDRTFFKNLKWLIKNKWITVNSKTGNHRIISFDRLCKKLELKGNTGVVFTNDNFIDFRPFIYAASILAKVRNRNWIIRQPVRMEGGTRKSMSTMEILRDTDTMPVRLMGKAMDLGFSTISRYKNAASDAGLISLHPNYESTNLPSSMLNAIKDANPEESSRYLVQNGKIWMRNSDKICNHEIKLKKRRLRPP
jgi:hypothetical protein